MKKLPLIGLAFALLLCISTGALGVPITYAANEVLLGNVLSEMDVEYTVAWDEHGDPFWTVMWSEIVFTIAAYDEQQSGDYASLLFYAGWETAAEISLADVNQWNSQSRFGRAYLDDSGDPAIELDLLLVGGITSQTIEEYILVFVSAISDLGTALQL